MNLLGLRFRWAWLLAAVLVPGVSYAHPSKPAKPAGKPEGKLDSSLRRLVQLGCSGTHSVIISTNAEDRGRVREALIAHGNTVTGEFPGLDAIVADVNCEDLGALESFGAVRAVSSNARVAIDVKPGKTTGKALITASLTAREMEGRSARAQSFNALATLGASDLRGAPRASIGVAVIDSGIQAGTDFDDRITAFYNFTRGNIKAASPRDDYGHGTHVAGLIGSEFVGVAPYVRLIGLKVLNQKGEGTTDNVVRAIEFAIANRELLGINILNLSLGHPIFEAAATDPLVQAVEHAARVGLTVVVAAGNFGINPDTHEVGYAGIVSPANAPSAIAAGAVNTFDTVSRRDDRVAPYSSRGPSWYDGFAKPDVVAPGHNVLSIAAAGSLLRREQEPLGTSGNYMRLSGTSMAAGVTTGVAALVLQANHQLTPNALKAVLEYTAIPVQDNAGAYYDALAQGTGEIQAGGAVMLAHLIDATAPAGSAWLSTGFEPFSIIGDEFYEWSQSLIWGNRRLAGEALLNEQRPAWAPEIVWGEGLHCDDDNIVWGNLFRDDDNIVWGNAFDAGDNIVWGNNVVWGNRLDDDNIVWGNRWSNDDNIVWGNNIVWGTRLGVSLDGDNIVWGNRFDDDNIVWGNSGSSSE